MRYCVVFYAAGTGGPYFLVDDDHETAMFTDAEEANDAGGDHPLGAHGFVVLGTDGETYAKDGVLFTDG